MVQGGPCGLFMFIERAHVNNAWSCMVMTEYKTLSGNGTMIKPTYFTSLNTGLYNTNLLCSIQIN